MTLTVKQLNRFSLLVCAPFLGILLWMVLSHFTIDLPEESFPYIASERPPAAAQEMDKLQAALGQAKETANITAASIKKTVSLYNKTNAEMNQIAKTAIAQATRPAMIYDKRITSKLGMPIQTIQSSKITASLFPIKAAYFTGYALKIKLKSPDAMKMVLGKDEWGGAETTLSAVKRYKAIAGVNAGGFADKGKKRYPLSTTMLNGDYVAGFQPTMKDLFFVGMDEDMKLIGGNFSSKQQLDALKPQFGASFVPILMKNKVALPIPQKWQTSPKRAPRTVVANYRDNQLLFLVTNGYDEKGSSGATLREMQILLSRYQAVDGYNLDGGGSSSLVFGGQVINTPSDGKLRSLPTHFLFFK
ncbi:phosphodiester glycosidase family protein [Paenibacillus sp. GCM10027626]|uniref:phosphodiester glycosidase family protein n=1 Tax=Paenibacillus sp. GCM10027626 TaxID=3273411 RepID=UPI003641A359